MEKGTVTIWRRGEGDSHHLEEETEKGTVII